MGTIAINNLYIAKMPNSCKECPLTYLDTGDDAYFGANERRCVIDDSCIDGMVSERAYDCPLIEAIPKADYENRLKADLVAMLTELRTEIDKQCKIPNNCASAYDWNNGVYACYKVVQQKIDALKNN